MAWHWLFELLSCQEKPVFRFLSFHNPTTLSTIPSTQCWSREINQTVKGQRSITWLGSSSLWNRLRNLYKQKKKEKKNLEKIVNIWSLSIQQSVKNVESLLPINSVLFAFCCQYARENKCNAVNQMILKNERNTNHFLKWFYWNGCNWKSENYINHTKFVQVL